MARKGGEALLRRRFSGAAVDRAQAVSQRYGVFALLVPSLLPPPAPFKLFVLLAGVSGLAPVRFALTIAFGRGLRYFGIGLLTLWYGQQTLAFLETNGRTVAYWLAGIVVAGALVALIWRQFRRRQDVLTSLREMQPFKRDVRKLKEFGLTESLEVGYRLSPRGRSALERLDLEAGRPSGRIRPTSTERGHE